MCIDIYLWRQIFVLVTGLFLSLNIGLMVAFPAVLNPSILDPNGIDIRATPSQASWIAASNGLAGVLGFFVEPPVLQIFGRKAFHITCNIFYLIGWIIYPLANGITALFAARIIQGIATGGVYIQSMIVAEYMHPERRGYFVTIQKIFITFGTLLCHSLVLVWDWRQISTAAIAMPIVSIFMTAFWPESPYFLAMKGRYEDCKKSFLWLRGPSCNDELQQLLATQKESRRSKNRKAFSLRKYFKRDFIKPFLIVSLITVLLDLSGRYFFMAYVTQIMVELIGDRSIAIYCSVSADCLHIIALLASCFLVSHFNRRTMLFVFSSLSIFFMFLVSSLVFLRRFDIGAAWLSPLVVILQSFVLNLGVVPTSFAIFGEVIPLEYRGVGSCSCGMVFTLFYAFTIKVTPALMSDVGVEGTYAIFGFCSAFCVALLYVMLPETKDKTLPQIENEIRGKGQALGDCNLKLEGVERGLLL